MFAARPVTSDQCTASRPEGGRGRAHEQEVASSCTRSSLLAQPCGYGALAQLGERRLCKPEVTGSIPVRSIAQPNESRLVEPFTARILAPPDTAQPRCFGGL